ncbi:MAG: S41 family peptidase [Burkholderiaceae bacterium]
MSPGRAGRRSAARLGGLVLALTMAFAASAHAAAGMQDAASTTEQHRTDFQEFCRQVEDNYAYFDTRETDWAAACNALTELAARATSREEFIAVLELTLRQLYDAHAHLAINTPRSPRLVPSGVEVQAAWIDGKAVVTDIWPGSDAARSGLRVGDELLMLDGVAIAEAAAPFTPTFLRKPDVRARNFGLQVALAGRHEVPHVGLRVRSGDTTRDVSYAPGRAPDSSTVRVAFQDSVAIIRIHNALGNEALIRDFDAALATVGGASALVLDLRDTPSGGNSTVARGILGRFVIASAPYQRHELVSEFRRTGVKRHWVEYVAPRPPVLDIPVVVLVGPWTGSMGEGLAIGWHHAAKALVAGRPMAGLLGALDEFRLPASGIVVRIPTEKLFSVDGTPRESFIPCALASTAANVPDADPQLKSAVELAQRGARGESGNAAGTESDPRIASCAQAAGRARGR